MSDVSTPGLTLDESARRLAALMAAKQLEFERLGSSARATAHPSLKVVLAAISAHQGRGAQLLESLLPVTRDHDPAVVIARERVRLLSPPSEAPPGDAGGLAGDPQGQGGQENQGDQELLERARGTLVSLIEGAEGLVRDLSPVSDPAVRRLVGLILEGDRQDLAGLSGVGIAGKVAQVTR